MVDSEGDVADDALSSQAPEPKVIKILMLRTIPLGAGRARGGKDFQTTTSQ